MRVVHWTIPALTISIFGLDLLVPSGVAVAVLYIFPLLLTFLSSSHRYPIYFCSVATVLTWVDVLLKPAGLPIPYALLNRALGTLAMWVIALGIIQYKQTQEKLSETETDKSKIARELTSERIERAHAEGLMVAAQEARAYADTALLGAAAARREAEEKVLLSQLSLESMIQSAMDAIITVDQDQSVVLFNRAAEQMFGCAAQEAIGQPLDRFIPSRFRTAHREHIKTFGRSRSTSRRMGALGQVNGLRADGTEFPIEAAISQVGLEGHRYFTVILRDITQRVRAEETLAESERIHRTLLSNLSGMAYRCRNDKDWTMAVVSEGCEALTGYPPEDLLDNRCLSFNSLIHPDDRQRVWDQFQKSLEMRGHCSSEYRIRTAGGEEKWVWDQAQGIRGTGGELLAIEGFITDITERKRATERWQQVQERYRRLVEVSPDAIFVYRDGQIIFMNDQGLRLFGAVMVDEILGKSLFEVFHPDSHAVIRDCFHQLVEGGTTVPIVEEQIVRLDGEVVDVEVSVARFVDQEGMAFLGVVRDISKRKRTEEQLRKAERLAELGTLASGMAHEIGTPMNVILGRAEYLLQRVKEEPIRKGLQTIVTQVERITKVMNQLLAFARRRPTERRSVDLRQVVEDNLDIFRERFARQSIKLETELAVSCPPVHADGDQMSQVIINLVMNAIQAMPGGGTLRVVLVPKKNMVALTVTDTGHGIPQDCITKVFDPFFTTKEFGKGTGLGLTVVKGIIEEHQGKIAVESEPETGTTFTIHLPMSSSS